MKKELSPSIVLLLISTFLIATHGKSQNIGIGTLTPGFKLHISGNTPGMLNLDNTTSLNTGVMSEMYLKSGLHYTGAIKSIGTGTVTARLGLFTYATTVTTGLQERMSITDNGYVGIGTTTPEYHLDVNGRMRVRHGNGTAGIYFMDATNANNRAFFGMKDDNTVGLFGGNGAGWALTMSTQYGTVDIQKQVSIYAQLYVSHSGAYYAASFNNHSNQGYPALEAAATQVSGMGAGVEAAGGRTGVYAVANMAGGNNHHYGVEAYGQNGGANNYGVYASASGGNNAIGIYALANNGTTNWAGYFSGSVYTNGSYQGSDRKLKRDIQPLQHALHVVKALKPSSYTYNTDTFHHMQLPEGPQVGLIADEVKQILPYIVKQAVQPAEYENNDERTGRMIADEVSFEAVNYTALIPVLIAAIQEQQAMIEELQKKMAELE